MAARGAGEPSGGAGRGRGGGREGGGGRAEGAGGANAAEGVRKGAELSRAGCGRVGPDLYQASRSQRYHALAQYQASRGQQYHALAQYRASRSASYRTSHSAGIGRYQASGGASAAHLVAAYATSVPHIAQEKRSTAAAYG
eukprot:2849514-Rhodomonas_salina.1